MFQRQRRPPAGAIRYHFGAVRLLIACPACARQYDAAGLAPDERFRCLCGDLLRVPRAAPHDAAVVRCSSCGAPRQGGATACGFCGADFTLHERDLHTLCPGCMARISDRGRYCHHCAHPVLPGTPAGEASEHPCPACGAGRRLISRRLTELPLPVLECPACAGLWVGNEVFRFLLEKTPAAPGEIAETAPVASRPERQPGPAYRPCPICGRLMHRRNYGRRSGVIFDSCRQHGLWFDARELEQILGWVRQGGHHAAARRREEEERAEEQRRRMATLAGEPPPAAGPIGRGGALIDLLIGVGRWLLGL